MTIDQLSLLAHAVTGVAPDHVARLVQMPEQRKLTPGHPADARRSVRRRMFRLFSR